MVNVDTQHDFQNSDTSFILSNLLQERIDDILEKARNKISSLKFPGEATDEILNNPLSQIKTIDIYRDDSLRDMLYPGDPMFILQSSTNDRKYFELNVSGKTDALDKIIEHLDLNLKQTLMSKDDRTETKQKINILKNLNRKFNFIKKIQILKNNFNCMSGLQS